MAAKGFTIPSIFTAVDKISGVVKNMGRNVGAFAAKAEAGIARADRALLRLTPGFGSAAKQVLSFASAAALAGAIISGIVFSFQSLKEYEIAVQSFRTIVSDLSDKDFAKYQQKIREVALDTKKSSIDVAKAFEMIAGLNAEFAKTPEAIGNVSAAAILLSKASRDDLGKSASNLTGILNQFELQADKSARVVNVLAAGQAVGASSITQTADAFTVFGAVAKNANLTLEQSVGLVEVLASKQIQGAEAGTALRGSLLALQKAGLGYKSGLFSARDALVEFNAKLNKLTTAKQKDAYFEKVFGVINRTTGTILAQNIDLYDKFTKGVTGTSEATKAAEINSSTFSNRLTELSAKWVTLITTSEKSSKTINIFSRLLIFLHNNLERVVAVGALIISFFIAWKLLLITVRIYLIAYNIVLGITGALSSTAAVAIGANAVALGAYKATLWLATAAQWAWNAALAASPILLFSAGVVVMLSKWNDWGAALSLTMAQFGVFISILQSFRRNWDMIGESISKAFKAEGFFAAFIAGLKAIGKIILDAILMPLEQVAKLMAKWTGKQFFIDSEKAFAAFRKNLDLNVTTDEDGNPLPNSTPVLNPEVERQYALRETFRENTNNARVQLDVNDPGRLVKARADSELVNINLSSTLGWGF